MSSTQSLPREELPPGWGPVSADNDRIEYRHRRPPITLSAVRVPADRSHPSLGLSRCWELRYRYSIGECLASEVLGCATTRSAAIESLLECMHHVHDTVESPNSPIDIRNALESVSLRALLPEASSTIS